PGGGFESPREKSSELLDNFRLPADIFASVEGISDAAISSPKATVDTSSTLAQHRAALQKIVGKLQRKVNSLIHFRLSYSLSPLLTLILGAVLGIMFRGGHALAAFGLALIPLAIATLVGTMGRQLAENVSTQHTGVWIMWGGLVALAIADVVMLRVGVRR